MNLSISLCPNVLVNNFFVLDEVNNQLVNQDSRFIEFDSLKGNDLLNSVEYRFMNSL